jgi:hypothetical protein
LRDYAAELNNSFGSHRDIKRHDLALFLMELNPSLKDSSLNWLIYNLIKANVIHRIVRDTFRIGPAEILRPDYTSSLSDEATELLSYMKDNYPLLNYIIWESRALNEFLNHQMARNYIFVEVERDLADLVFDRLENKFDYRTLFKPTEKEITLYSDQITVVILGLNTEAPIKEHEPLLEKLLVDLFANKLISYITSPSEFDFVYEEAFAKYKVNPAAMLRYARRRNKEPIVKEYIERNTE